MAAERQRVSCTGGVPGQSIQRGGAEWIALGSALRALQACILPTLRATFAPKKSTMRALAVRDIHFDVPPCAPTDPRSSLSRQPVRRTLRRLRRRCAPRWHGVPGIDPSEMRFDPDAHGLARTVAAGTGPHPCPARHRLGQAPGFGLPDVMGHLPGPAQGLPRPGHDVGLRFPPCCT